MLAALAQLMIAICILAASWKAGVVGYEVDFSARTVSYYGACGEQYIEDYPLIEI
jgi:uncharacterized protein YbcV (DUF1398 family)